MAGSQGRPVLVIPRYATAGHPWHNKFQTKRTQPDLRKGKYFSNKVLPENSIYEGEAVTGEVCNRSHTSVYELILSTKQNPGGIPFPPGFLAIPCLRLAPSIRVSGLYGA